uniref:Uncharacterized protein n=1 Tax=Picea sitchensis TaxID=3332 RepID=A0A6B9XVX3_PICSI|nr:hypothetical protein Q903MT_gene3829 [Picea sitchensis]
MLGLKEGQFRLGGHIEWIRFHKRARREDRGTSPGRAGKNSPKKEKEGEKAPELQKSPAQEQKGSTLIKLRFESIKPFRLLLSTDI